LKLTRISRHGRGDALVVSEAANPNGLISGSGSVGQKRQVALLMDSLAPHYGDDSWFTSYHAMALSEDRRLAAVRAKIERSIAMKPNNAHGAHGFAHVCYESGERDMARHLSLLLARHLSARRLFLRSSELAFDAVRDSSRQLGRSTPDLPGGHRAAPAQRRTATETVRRRCVLVARRTRRHPRDPAARRGLYEYASSALPRAGNGLADLHVILAQAVMGDDVALDARGRQMQELAREGVTPRALTFLHWRAASRRSSGRIFPARSRRWRSWRAKTNALAAAAHSTT
jgi:hypothetical protein